MKVLLLGSANSVHIVRWVNALCERGNEIHLVTQVNHKPDAAISGNVKVYELPVSGGKGYYLNAFALKRLVKEIKPDVINVHYASGYGTLMRMAKLKQAILSVWGSDVYDFPYQNKRHMKIIRKNLSYPKVIASTSNCMAEQVRKLLGRNIDIPITPFGVETENYTVGHRNNPDEIVIGCIKTLEPTYGMDYLVQAIGILIDKLENEGLTEIAQKVICKIYGGGPQREELQELINNQHLTGKVQLLGQIPHESVPDVLAQMDIFCVLSNMESFGVAAIEASAAGLPVVASDAEGFQEVIEDNVTGIIVKRREPMQAAEALEKLILNAGLRREMGVAGRKRVEHLYEWDENVATMEQIYKSVIQ